MFELQEKKLNNFSAKSKWVLGVLSILCFIAFITVENNKVDVKKNWYNQKLQASLLSKKAAEYLKNYRLDKGIFIDAVNDPNNTALIGQDITPITTDRGYIESKLTATNPNWAAVMVELLKDADVNEGDIVAVSLTGSLPGINIAVLSALQTLKLKPVVISSVGASNWGANDPYFTWIDMEKVLFDAGIFKYRSIAASAGGGLDRGRGLSPEGRSLIENAIRRNNIEYINEQFLGSSIEKRMEIYYREKGSSEIKAFINVGGGIASLGAVENEEFIPGGLTKVLPMKNFPVKGVLIRMAEESIPIIHILNVVSMAAEFGIPASPEPLPQPGEGDIFVKKQYSMLLTIFVTSLLISAVLFVFIMERKRHQVGSEVVSTSLKIHRDLVDEVQL